MTIEEGVIVAARHIHFHTTDAERWASLINSGSPFAYVVNAGLYLENVIARVSDAYALDMHIDTDEANAAGVKTGDEAEIIK